MDNKKMMMDKQMAEGIALHQAILLAGMAHKGQLRKGTALDYLVHPMEVLEILSSMHADINLRIAGVLHDTLEDTKLSAIQIREQFGDDVADLVVEHTENKERSWKERKQEHIRKLYHGSTRHRMLVLADSLSNLRSMAADYKVEGNDLWKRFRAPKDEQNWYYHGMRRGMAELESLPETQGAYLEMTALCDQVFGDEITL